MYYTAFHEKQIFISSWQVKIRYLGLAFILIHFEYLLPLQKWFFPSNLGTLYLFLLACSITFTKEFVSMDFQYCLNKLEYDCRAGVDLQLTCYCLNDNQYMTPPYIRTYYLFCKQSLMLKHWFPCLARNVCQNATKLNQENTEIGSEI